VSSSGRQARTRTVMARVCSATLVFRSWMRRATARRLAAVAMVSVSQAVCSRSLPQHLTRRGVVRSRSRLRRGQEQQRPARGVGVGHRWRPGPPSGGGQPHRQRRPLASGPWLGELVAAQRLAAALVASRESDLAPWRRAVRLAGPALPPVRRRRAGTGPARRRRHRCPQSPTPAGLAAGSPAPAAAGSQLGRLARSPAGSPRRSQRRPRPRCECACGCRPRRASSTTSASMAIR
jgi:hypothetical protein